MQRNRGSNPFGFIFFIAIVLIMAAAVFFFMGPSHQAKKAVDTFYSYEQEARFASSWDMFHSEMQGKFSRNNYLQDRAHVFLNHFGVESFNYSLSRPKGVSGWQMTSDSEPLGKVYKVTVTKKYHGKYGHFKLIQDVYTVKEDKDWRILWDYNDEVQ